MPVGIDAETERPVRLGVVGSEGASSMTQQRGTVRSAYVQAHVVRISPVEAVAVDTSLELRVLYQRTLVEGGEVALVDSHVLIRSLFCQ